MALSFRCYYAGFQADERVQRLGDISKLAPIFDGLISPFSDADPNCLKAVQTCAANGMKVTLIPNALTPEQFKAKYASQPNIDMVDIWDDAHETTPDKIAAKRDLWLPVIGNNRLLSITAARKTDAAYVNIVPVFAGQYYTWKEGGWLTQWYWTDVGRLMAASTSKRIAPTLYLGMNAVTWPLRNTPDWRTADREYTPVKQQEAAALMAICRGVTDLWFYTAYEWPCERGISLESGKSYIVDRPIWLAQYKAMIGKLKRLDAAYFQKGTRVERPLANNVCGATWTLPDGSGVTITIDATEEVYPDVRVDPFDPPTVTNLSVVSNGPVTVRLP